MTFDTGGFTDQLPAIEADSRRRIAWALFVFVIVASGGWLHQMQAQEASRYALTAALTESGTVRIDDYVHILTVDASVRDGHVYSDKAPGQPLLAIPFFAAYRWVGGEPATVLRHDVNLGLWWVSLWSSAIPLAILSVLIYRFALAIRPERALPAALAMVFGTMLFPFGALLFGHVLAACLLFGAYFIIEWRPKTAANGLLVGLLLGAAVVVEYPAAIGAVALAVLALWVGRLWALWLLPGAVFMAGSLAIYNLVAFGDAVVFSYSYSAFNEVTEQARGTFDIFSTFQAEHLVSVFVSSRGFLIATPVVVLTLLGLGSMARHKGLRRYGLVPIALFALFLLIPLFWGNAWGGSSPGPRYMTPVLPFLAVGLAYVWPRTPRLAIAASAVSILTMSAAVLTDPRLRQETEGALGVWLSRIGDGQLSDTVLTPLLGGGGLVVLAVMILLAGIWLRHQAARGEDSFNG